MISGAPPPDPLARVSVGSSFAFELSLRAMARCSCCVGPAYPGLVKPNRRATAWRACPPSDNGCCCRSCRLVQVWPMPRLADGSATLATTNGPVAQVVEHPALHGEDGDRNLPGPLPRRWSRQGSVYSTSLDQPRCEEVDRPQQPALHPVVRAHLAGAVLRVGCGSCAAKLILLQPRSPRRSRDATSPKRGRRSANSATRTASITRSLMGRATSPAPAAARPIRQLPVLRGCPRGQTKAKHLLG
jgi:hypothetical protein